MSKNSILSAIVIVLGGLFASAAHAGCDYPDQMTSGVPDGKSASKEQMIAAQKEVKAYVQRMEDYLACLDAEVDALGEEATEEHKLIRDKRHNAAIDAMDVVAGEFNLAVREFKARD